MPAYRDVKPFTPPEGVVSVTLDKATNRIATPNCPDDYSAAFIVGTEPHENCESGNLFTKILGALMPKPAAPVSNTQPQPGQQRNETRPPVAGQEAAAPPVPQKEEKKKGFWGRLFGGDDKKEEDKKKEDNTKPQSSQPPGTAPNPR